jgi:hypothetical protein
MGLRRVEEIHGSPTDNPCFILAKRLSRVS